MPCSSNLRAPERVEIPAYTDRWMMGDRYGEVILFGIGTRSDLVKVKLDKSGKTVWVWHLDCRFI